MTDKEVRASNKRVLGFAIACFVCISLIGGCGFLLIFAITHSYGGDISILVEEHPRITVIAAAAALMIIVLFIGLIFYIKGLIADNAIANKAAKERYQKAKRSAQRACKRNGVRFNLSAFNKKYRAMLEKEKKDKEDGIEEYPDGPLSFVPSFGAPAKEIKKKEGEEAETEHHRFPTLSAYDDAHPAFEQIERDPSLTLESLCDDFRDFCASERGLYYSKRDIRTFISALSASHTMILQGMSGTGKTSLPVAFGVYIGSSTDVVPVQPTWKERSDVLGYYNEFTGAYSESELLKALYSAGGTDAVKLIVLDEANIARVEYYFAEFLSLLELPDPSRRRVPAAPSGMAGDPRRMDGGSILLPENAFFVLTANNDDSTFAFSDKVYDRASVMDLDSRAEPFDAPRRPAARLGWPQLSKMFDEAAARYSLTGRDLRRVSKIDAWLRENLGLSFGNRILLQMRRFVPAFVACGGTAEEALDLLLARKVLRKLSAANPVVVRSKAPELLSLLSAVFGEGNAPVCESAVKRYVEG